MKRRWLFLASVPITFAVCLCFFSVRVRIAPRIVLTGALNRTITDLESRFERSPVHLLEKVIDPAGRQKASLQLETKLPLLGVVRYDMELQTQLNPIRVSGSGTVVAGGEALDLSLYLDKNFAALSSENLTEKRYYGITYDTFSQDIRSRDTLAYLIGDDTISRWETDVSKLNRFMSQDLTIPQISPDDLRCAGYAVLVLDPEVSTRRTVVAGESIKVHSITFRVSADQIVKAAELCGGGLSPELAAWIRAKEDDPNLGAEVVFYMNKGTIVKLEANIRTSDDSTQASICFGEQDKREALSLDIAVLKDNNAKQISLLVDNTPDSMPYEENVQLTCIENGVQNYAIEYSYSQSSGEMDLCILKDIRKAQIRMHLAGEGSCLTITTQNMGSILNLFREIPLNTPVICTISVMPGERVSMPSYQNLVQWSIEDIWMLLENFGTLIGIRK